MRISALAGMLAAGLLGGCAATVHPVPTTIAAPGMPNPELALQRSMQRVSAEMAELGRIGPSPAPAEAVVPAPLQRIVSFTWHGPLDKAVATLAQSIGYTCYVTAPPRTKPLIVSVQLSSVPIYLVFKALGDQAGTRATVEVDPLHASVLVIDRG